MAGTGTQWLRNTLIASYFGAGPTLYLALTNSVPPLGATNDQLIEPQGGGYTRVAISSWDITTFPGAALNAQQVSFANATADWGTLYGWALVTYAGDVAAVGSLVVPARVPVATGPNIPALSVGVGLFDT